MGNICTNCIYPWRSPSDSRTRLLSNYYPSEDDLPRLPKPTLNDNRFYYLPDKLALDKTIQELDSLRSLSQNHLLKAELAHAHLEAAKLLVDSLRDRFNYLAPTPSSHDLAKIVPPLNTTALTHGGKLILEVQQAMLVSHDIVGKANFKKSYVVIEVSRSENIRDSLPISSEKYVSREVVGNLYEPKWCEVFEHGFDAVPDPRLVSINISLVYEGDSGEGRTVLGDVQTFRLSSLLDQEVYLRELDLKDKVTKGTIARLSVRFQLIHQPVLLQTKLLTEINNRQDKLNNILSKATSPTRISGQSSLKYSIGGSNRLKQSNQGNARPSGLNGSIYFEEKFFINSDVTRPSVKNL